MGKKKNKILIFAIATLFFCFVLLTFSLLHDSKTGSISVISNDHSVEKSIKIFNNQDKDFLFMPSGFEIDEESEVSDDIEIMQLSDIPSMWIDTSSESMKEVFNNEKHDEYSLIATADEYGNVALNDVVCTIGGHGNSTWEKNGKKPFELKFTEAVSILGMKNADEWILLANAFDDSNLNNKIIFDIANNTFGINTPECKYVNLYINGNYYGLYLLAQDVDSFMTYNMDDSFVLLSSELTERISKEDYVISIAGSNIIVKNQSSDTLDVDVKKILDDVNNQIENGSISNNVFDFETWGQKYLLDEVFENQDAGITSNYFYIDFSQCDNFKIYGGPIWDYDLTFGCCSAKYNLTTINPEIIYAGNQFRDSNNAILWYYNLMQNEGFRDSVIETYSDILKPCLQKMLEIDIDREANLIEQSVLANNIVWNIDSDFWEDVTQRKEWIASRINFLDNYWVNNIHYNFVQIDAESTSYYRLCLKDGESILDSPYFYEYGKVNENTKLKNIETAESYNIDSIVTENMKLRIENKYSSLYESIYNKVYYNFEWMFSMGCLLILFIAIVGMVLHERKQALNK